MSIKNLEIKYLEIKINDVIYARDFGRRVAKPFEGKVQ